MITSTKNPRIVAVRKLSQRKHRQKQNRFLVEGLQLLGMAIEARATRPNNIKPLELFYSESLFTGDTAPRLLAQLVEAGAEAIPVAPNIMDTLSQRDTSQGIIATFALQELESSIEDLQLLITNNQSPNPPIPQSPVSNPKSQISNLILTLDQLQDPGNLGTLIRTADAVGVQAIILLEPCVDPFDPKTIRGTMGSIFTVPFMRAQNPAGILPQLSDMGYHLVGADARLGKTAWESNVLFGPTALILGNEARGLNPELHPHLTDYVSLPILGHAESLNVSIAGGVLMYEWLRVNK